MKTLHRYCLIFFWLLILGGVVTAQDDPSIGKTAPEPILVVDEAPGGPHKAQAMPSGFMTLMNRMGSGTSWQPSSGPNNMVHGRLGGWHVMYHYEAKLGLNHQGGPRGVTKFESQNWFMPMAMRQIGRGTLTLRGMFSLEPFTFSGAGSPQLFQTGEVYRGKSIVDAQHPHDVMMELAALYEVPVRESGSVFAYVGWPGEPALGPVAFMHRASAAENPAAPLSHHLQDSTHISQGVLTLGASFRGFRLEGSVFNGKEPDEKRKDIEVGAWNSRSVRVSYAPNQNWVAQVSYGLLKNPERLHAGDTRRITASVQYNRPLPRGNWASTVVWGRNREEHRTSGEVFRLNSYLVESTLNFLDRNYVYTRLELVDKKDLLRPEEAHQLGYGQTVHHPQFRIGGYTLGYSREIRNTAKYSLAVGGDLTWYSKPGVLDSLYGQNPVSSKFFFRIRPARMGNQHDH
ncbi:MAG: hypothetical protein K1Y36_14135 [Blastocatellia bacterium]|nr:hypothetical protein [Blastocatellia bacterium]